MKKPALIIILIVVTVVSLIYGYSQQAAAAKVISQAESRCQEDETLTKQAQKEATLKTEEARVQAENARRAEAVAKMAQALAEENQRQAELPLAGSNVRGLFLFTAIGLSLFGSYPG